MPCSTRWVSGDVTLLCIQSRTSPTASRARAGCPSPATIAAWATGSSRLSSKASTRGSRWLPRAVTCRAAAIARSCGSFCCRSTWRNCSRAAASGGAAISAGTRAISGSSVPLRRVFVVMVLLYPAPHAWANWSAARPFAIMGMRTDKDRRREHATTRTTGRRWRRQQIMGRLLFGIVLAVVGLLYLGAAWMALFNSNGFLSGDAWWGAILFLVVGVLAAGASVNLLREKRR